MMILNHKLNYLFNVMKQTSTFKSECCWAQVWLLATQKVSNWEESFGRKEMWFNQKSWQSGEKVDLCPKTNWRILSAMTTFKGKKRGRILVNHWGKRVGSAFVSIVCKLADSLFILSRWSACRLANGATEGR